MAGVVLVQSCFEADYNAATATCAAPIWNPQESAYPTLSIADAQEIGMSLALLWAIAWGLRTARKALNEIG
ncbi:MAG: hypothetical protein ACREPE_01335 [Lysobacter sp.]